MPLNLGYSAAMATRQAVETYIKVAETCFEGDDGGYRHGGCYTLLRSRYQAEQ